MVNNTLYIHCTLKCQNGGHTKVTANLRTIHDHAENINRQDRFTHRYYSYPLHILSMCKMFRYL